MTKRFIEYNKIGQFRNIAHEINHICEKDGQPMPTVNITATEKIHGTNASVCFSVPDGFWVQSRGRIITPEEDNGGCARKAMENKESWMAIIKSIARENNIDLEKNIVSVFYEWCGGSIQSKSAMTGLEKQSMIFQHFKVSSLEKPELEDANEEVGNWYEVGTHADTDNGIHNIVQFPRYFYELDFKNPTPAINKIVELVEKTIEPNSPVGKTLGKDGNTGEGVVCTFTFNDTVYKFKVKGEKHSGSKVKKTVVKDEGKEADKIEFANYSCTAGRLEQAWQKTFGIDNEKMLPSTKAIGSFLKLVTDDIFDEEADILKERGLTERDVQNSINNMARKWFLSEMRKDGLG